MTVKEYFERYWFFNVNEEANPHGCDLPIVKFKDGTLLVCSVILKEDQYFGVEKWLDAGSFFHCLIPSISDLDDNIYNYIPDLGDYVSIDKLEKLASEHGGVIVDPEILKYSFISKLFNTFTMSADLFCIVRPDLLELKNKYEK